MRHVWQAPWQVCVGQFAQSRRCLNTPPTLLADEASARRVTILLLDAKRRLAHRKHDTVSERLRRWTRNPLGSARRGSNPLGVEFAQEDSFFQAAFVSVA